MRRGLTRTRTAPLTALVVAVAGTAAFASSVGEEHRLNAVFRQASHVVPGLEVRAAGQKVGEVVQATPSDGQARLELRLDDTVWPLTEGTTARLRFGGTIAYASRYIELDPGPEDAPPIPENGLLPAADTVTPVEFDRWFRTYDKRTRRDLRRFFDQGGPAFERLSGELRAALEKTPPTMVHTSAMLEDLGRDPRALTTLVRSGDRVMGALAASEPGLRELVGGMATTFDAFAGQAAEIEAALDRAAPALAAVRTTLPRADRTLVALRNLARPLRPGIRRMREVPGPASDLLERLVDVGPAARRALATARGSAPEVTSLLSEGDPLMRRLESIGRQGAPQLACVRPYAPEIAGTVSTWAGLLALGDEEGKYARYNIKQLTYDPGYKGTPAQLIAEQPFVTYAFPQPPGVYAGQPWFQPGCGVGPETLDPSKDPEAP